METATRLLLEATRRLATLDIAQEERVEAGDYDPRHGQSRELAERSA